jgi:hypothetical protein
MQKSLHDRLCELRDQLFAHTDETELRGIVDAHELLGIGFGGYVEEYAAFNTGALPDIAELADLLEERFAARIHEIQEQLARNHPEEES